MKRTTWQGWTLAVAGGWLWLSGCGSGADQKVLAVVGEQKITVADFKQALNNLPENYKILAESYNGKHKILDNLVKKELLVMEAERRGYQKDGDVKAKLKELQAKTTSEFEQRLADMKQRAKSLPRQVYENVLLSELNRRLKQEGAEGVEVADSEVKEYYDDYARKLKVLNPAAKVPALEAVQKQIHAILVEEKLIRNLQKQHSVEVKETLFRDLYGENSQDLIIDDSGKR
ncbi:MAG: hypothetical protein AB1439_07850 [candidate division FCPU426 bacterium]